jgi:hypothetical protein
MLAIADDFPMKLEREAGMPDHVPPVSVGFGLSAILDDAKTAEAGHEVYKDVEFIKIAIPGDRNSLFFQPATEQHKKRFPRAWADYKARDITKPREGLPIENWAPISRATALNLKAVNIHTVEDLAVVHDGHVASLGIQGRELRAKAQAFLEQARDTAAATRAAKEKQELQDQIKALQAQIADLAARAPAPPAVTAAPLPDVTADVEDDVARAARRPRAGRV